MREYASITAQAYLDILTATDIDFNDLIVRLGDPIQDQAIFAIKELISAIKRGESPLPDFLSAHPIFSARLPRLLVENPQAEQSLNLDLP